MNIADRVSAALVSHKKTELLSDELERLQNFLSLMKAAGITKVQEYDLPQPDTLGRAIVEKFQNRPIQS